jgi:hypothetical protein
MAQWCTIESDPGVFSELIATVGVKGVMGTRRFSCFCALAERTLLVEEIFDIESMGQDEKEVFGVIFLFKVCARGVCVRDRSYLC